ncbi:hypothetical protein BDZ85DRAFT_125267 [Elsinoe ampelina]|uniref:Uncharacterized protein n=1 Tax=Elsinoe ampelina TaxID=302913 RepID=A0A6A6G908_9PEZI|nr:hypothetical protein BDZ85DRAFT_125267 [Elsinoe ampelina]
MKTQTVLAIFFAGMLSGTVAGPLKKTDNAAEGSKKTENTAALPKTSTADELTVPPSVPKPPPIGPSFGGGTPASGTTTAWADKQPSPSTLASDPPSSQDWQVKEHKAGGTLGQVAGAPGNPLDFAPPPALDFASKSTEIASLPLIGGAEKKIKDQLPAQGSLPKDSQIMPSHTDLGNPMKEKVVQEDPKLKAEMEARIYDQQAKLDASSSGSSKPTR